MDDYLSRCPFCSSVAILDEFTVTRWNKNGPKHIKKYIAQCIIPKCVGHHGKSYTDKQKAINLWNQRGGITIKFDADEALVNETRDFVTSAIIKARRRRII